MLNAIERELLRKQIESLVDRGFPLQYTTVTIYAYYIRSANRLLERREISPN